MVAAGKDFIKIRIRKRRRAEVNFLAEFLMTQPGLIHGTGGNAAKIFPDDRKQAEHGKALECQQNPAAGLLLYRIQNLQIIDQGRFIHDITRCGYPGIQKTFLHESCSNKRKIFCCRLKKIREPGCYHKKLSVHGSPHRFNASMNGSGSNSSTLNTPAAFHFPVSIIMAPIMVGTPVV